MKCQSCIWYRVIRSDWGECHLNPPAIESENPKAESWLWPKVSSEDFCSHWEEISDT